MLNTETQESGSVDLGREKLSRRDDPWLAGVIAAGEGLPEEANPWFWATSDYYRSRNDLISTNLADDWLKGYRGEKTRSGGAASGHSEHFLDASEQVWIAFGPSYTSERGFYNIESAASFLVEYWVVNRVRYAGSVAGVIEGAKKLAGEVAASLRTNSLIIYRANTERDEKAAVVRLALRPEQIEELSGRLKAD